LCTLAAYSWGKAGVAVENLRAVADPLSMISINRARAKTKTSLQISFPAIAFLVHVFAFVTLGWTLRSFVVE